MNKFFNFFVVAIAVAATAFSVVSCDDEEDYATKNPYHNGGKGK